MSEQTNPITHNVYFEGNVQSLGLATAKGPATVGVMKKGPYQFSTSTPETMVVISGIMNIKLADGEWTQSIEQGKFDVPGNSKFDIMCDTDVAYICYYG